jgi:aspartate kinase
MGASVFHEEAMFPVSDASIPTNIRNTNNPTHPGTIISERVSSDTSEITGIAGSKGFCVITLVKTGMNNDLGFLVRAAQVFLDHQISIEHPPTGVDAISFVCRELSPAKAVEVINSLKSACNPKEIKIERSLALLAVVGRGMKGKIGVAAKILTAVSTSRINHRILSQGATENCIIVGVDEDDLDEAIRSIYNAFV